METLSDHVVAKLKEQAGRPAARSVPAHGDLKPSAPGGFFKDEITL